MVVNGNGSVNGQGMGGTSVLGPGQSPEGRQLSPLTSPLLTDAGYVRNEDEDEARRKVGMQTGRFTSFRTFLQPSHTNFLTI